jgi:NAD(P) transhydrogenase
LYTGTADCCNATPFAYRKLLDSSIVENMMLSFRATARTFARRTSTRVVAFSSGQPYDTLTVGIPKETFELEKRVAATPESIARLKGFQRILVEDGAGVASHFNNSDYERAGATIVPHDEVWKKSDIVLKVRGYL